MLCSEPCAALCRMASTISSTRRVAILAGALNLQIDGQVFSGDIQGLIPELDAGLAFGCHHITI